MPAQFGIYPNANKRRRPQQQQDAGPMLPPMPQQAAAPAVPQGMATPYLPDPQHRTRSTSSINFQNSVRRNNNMPLLPDGSESPTFLVGGGGRSSGGVTAIPGNANIVPITPSSAPRAPGVKPYNPADRASIRARYLGRPISDSSGQVIGYSGYPGVGLAEALAAAGEQADRDLMGGPIMPPGAGGAAGNGAPPFLPIGVASRQQAAAQGTPISPYLPPSAAQGQQQQPSPPPMLPNSPEARQERAAQNRRDAQYVSGGQRETVGKKKDIQVTAQQAAMMRDVAGSDEAFQQTIAQYGYGAQDIAKFPATVNQGGQVPRPDMAAPNTRIPLSTLGPDNGLDPSQNYNTPRQATPGPYIEQVATAPMGPRTGYTPLPRAAEPGYAAQPPAAQPQQAVPAPQAAAPATQQQPRRPTRAMAQQYVNRFAGDSRAAIAAMEREGFDLSGYAD